MMNKTFRKQASRSVSRRLTRTLSTPLSLLAFLTLITACGDTADAEGADVDDDSAHICTIHIEYTDEASGELDFCATRTFPTHTAQECEDDKRDIGVDDLDSPGKVVSSCTTNDVAATCKWTVASFAGTDVSYAYTYYQPLECYQAKFLCDDDEAEFTCTDI